MISGSEEAVYEAGVRRWVLSTLHLDGGALNTAVGLRVAVYDMFDCERCSNSWGVTRLARAQHAFPVLEGRAEVGAKGSSESRCV